MDPELHDALAHVAGRLGMDLNGFMNLALREALVRYQMLAAMSEVYTVPGESGGKPATDAVSEYDRLRRTLEETLKGIPGPTAKAKDPEKPEHINLRPTLEGDLPPLERLRRSDEKRILGTLLGPDKPAAEAEGEKRPRRKDKKS
jgi:hypothetical protein